MSKESALIRGLDRLSALLAWVGVIALLAMMVHVTVDVVSKLLFGKALIGTIEVVSSYYMLGCVFLPLALVQRHREHIVVDFFTERMSPPVRKASNVTALLATLLIVALLAWAGFTVALEQTEMLETTNSTTARFQVWPTRWLPVAAYVLTALYLAVELLRELGSKPAEAGS